MATVLRVRRKRSSDPSEALIFSCKKARTSGDGSGKGSATAAGAAGGGADIKTVFKFAGTVDKKFMKGIPIPMDILSDNTCQALGNICFRSAHCFIVLLYFHFIQDQPISQRIQAALSTVHLYANLEPPKPQAKPKPTSTSTSSSSSSSSSKKSKKSKSKSKSKSKQDTKSKSRASQLASQQEGRFQIVSTYRGVNLKELDGQRAPSSVSNGVSRNKGGAKDELFSLFDAVIDEEASSSYQRQSSKTDSITCNSVQMIREKLVIDDGPASEYVYDLYYTDDNQLDFGQTVVTGVQLEDEELVHDFFDEGSHETYDDEDDSNDENNWRNDYPDEDPDKRHEDLFDEYKDEYRYGDVSSDDDILNDYSDYRKRPAKNLDYFGGRDPLDDLM
nr:probable RNA polymerase II nuclear localization protein SLC7A6OS [Lytechinus pictus]